TIVWGDTLSGISQATNLTVQKLADLNKIANVDLIYAGNTLVFDGNVVTAKNDKGETVAQSVVTPQDKNDANKPVGKQAPAKQAEETAPGKTASSQSQNKQGTPAASDKTATSSQGKSAAVSGTNGSQTGMSGSVGGTTSSTAGTTTSSGTVETPAQPSEPATPSQPTQPSKPAEKPTTPTQPSTGGEQGGSTTPDTTPINMGNSGKVFDSEEAASEYGYAEIANEKSPWYGYRFGASQLV
ncbi:LysM peptidoglycan-binding domain-containing protein, partial [Enterococcus gallinarum]|uniref:LysM peptidoglycan-binding domain-containing protein n=1 Tax=Enterococcus gallinarum TaxID=1353 RepID=UPI0020909741